jgi:hypothetical protein
LKNGISPGVAAVVIGIVVVLAAVLIWKGVSGGSSKAPGETGNASPFERGITKGAGAKPNVGPGRGGPPGMGGPGGGYGSGGSGGVPGGGR